MKTLSRVEMKDFMIGNILGDGNLRRKNLNQNATYRESHDVSQKEYLLWKKAMFEKNLDVTFFAKDFVNNHGKLCFGIDSRVHAYFTKLHGEFYLPKRMPRDMIERDFGVLGLSVLYMDDGCTDWKKNGNINCCEFHLEDFSREDVEWFQKDMLKGRFGFESKFALVKKKYPKVRLYGDSGSLLKLISPIVGTIGCMKYKISFAEYSLYRARQNQLEYPTSLNIKDENVC